MEDVDSRFYQKVMNTLLYKDLQKVNAAVIGYVFLNKEPCMKGCRKEAFEKLRPILNKWKEEFRTLKARKESSKNG